MPLLNPDDPDPEALGAQDLLLDVLVHPDGRGQDARPRVGDALKLQEALDAAVVAVLAVQGDEGKIDPRFQRLVGDRLGLRLEALRNVRCRVLGDELPGQDPQAAAGRHEKRDRLETLPIHVVVDVSPAVQGHLPLGGHPAEDDADS